MVAKINYPNTLFECIRKRCLELPKEEILSVDGQMVPLTGRLDIKQYFKNKPYPWGVKMFALYGSSGTAYDFLIYRGATTEIELYIHFVFSASVVLHLTWNIYFDNFYLKS